MRTSSLALSVVLASSASAFTAPMVPVRSQQPSISQLDAVSKDSIHHQAASMAAGAMLSLALMLAPDVVPAANAAAPAATATVATTKATTAKPGSVEKQAVDSAKALLDSSNSKLAAAQKQIKAAEDADKKALDVLTKAENEANKAKKNFMAANDKLSSVKSDSKVSEKTVEAQRAKVGT